MLSTGHFVSSATRSNKFCIFLSIDFLFALLNEVPAFSLTICAHKRLPANKANTNMMNRPMRMQLFMVNAISKTS